MPKSEFVKLADVEAVFKSWLTHSNATEDEKLLNLLDAVLGDIQMLPKVTL